MRRRQGRVCGIWRMLREFEWGNIAIETPVGSLSVVDLGRLGCGGGKLAVVPHGFERLGCGEKKISTVPHGN